MEFSSEFVVILLLAFYSLVPCQSSSNPEDDVSKFRVINRRSLWVMDCSSSSSYSSVSIQTSPTSPLPNESNVTVTVSGVRNPSDSDWVGMITPSDASIDFCPLIAVKNAETGDTTTRLPFLCHYPVKAQYLSNDPSYLSCGSETCSGKVTFHVINIRTEIEFVFFANGFAFPCLVKRSSPLQFANPAMPLYGHISSMDSSSTKVKLTWISGHDKPEEVQYGFERKSSRSDVITFTKDNMSNSSPAQDYGWHNPGYIHSAVLTGLMPSSTYTYRYGSDLVGWSEVTKFNTPPAGGSDNLSVLVYGDMGNAPLDPSVVHYSQPGAISVASAVKTEIKENKVDSIFHIGDISYATGFLVEWDYFLHHIEPIASTIPYMTAIGNHEYDYTTEGMVYGLTDSGGELGVPYASYFQMPVLQKDEPWHAIEQGPVHFTVISTEHDWSTSSKQFEWIKADMSSINRTRTPWLIFTGHRPMYSSNDGPFFLRTVDIKFRNSLEPLLLNCKVDLVLFGHVHNYERTCAVFQDECKGMPIKGTDGVDLYDNNNYTAPVHVMAGMAGFKLDGFPDVKHWSLARFEEFGFGRIKATKMELIFEFVNSTGMVIRDSFRIIKKVF